MFVVGASLIALCIAARRLGVGLGADGSTPSFWLASMFVVGAALLLVVFAGRLLQIMRRR